MKLKNPDLSAWNEIGRSVARRDSTQITDFHEGRIDEATLAEDSRSPELAELVLAEIVRLNAQGRGHEARALFDPAHTPFIPELEKGGRGLGCCSILGPDEFLVNQGTYYTSTTTWHIRGDRIAEAKPLAAFTWSRNRKHFVAVQSDGVIEVRSGYLAEPHDTIPAIPGSAFMHLPDAISAKFEMPGDDAAYTHLAISDDGQKILLCDAERGVALLRKAASSWDMQLLYPSMRVGLEDQARAPNEDDGDFGVDLAMLHAAMSPDGRYAALETQDYGHYLIDLEAPNGPAVHAKLGHLSEYPHDACFSSDSGVVAFNSCHFYNGMTFASTVSAVKGLVTQPYEEHPAQTVLDTFLRVYASGYLPSSMTKQDEGAFLLAGSGFASCVQATGNVLWAMGFGSSAGGVDICPETGRVLLSSHSGMLHLLDPSQQQDPPISSGYRAPQEERRWLFWDRLKHPIIW